MDDLIHILIQYKYFVLLPLAVVEGPILAIVAGFLCSAGFLNPWIAFPIIVLGDIIGDSICYSFGKFGTPPIIRSIAYRLGFDNSRIEGVRVFFETNPEKVILLSKITLGIGVAGIYLAGLTRIPYGVFIRICLWTSCCQYIIYLVVGWFFGHAYQQINHYLNETAALSILVVMVLLVFFIVKSIPRKT